MKIQLENHLKVFFNKNSKNQNAEIIGDHEYEEENVFVMKNKDQSHSLFCNMPLYSYPDLVDNPEMTYNVILMNLAASWQQPYNKIEKGISAYDSPEDWRQNGWLIEVIGSVYMMAFYYGGDYTEDSDIYDGIARGNFKYFFGGEDNYAFENTNFYSYVVIDTDETINIKEDGEEKIIKAAYIFPLYKNEYKTLEEDPSKLEKIVELFPDFIVDPNRDEIIFDEED